MGEEALRTGDAMGGVPEHMQELHEMGAGQPSVHDIRMFTELLDNL